MITDASADGRPLVLPVWFVPEGDALVSEEPGGRNRTATEIARRCTGAERAEEFGRRNAVPGEPVVRLRPVEVIAAMNKTD